MNKGNLPRQIDPMRLTDMGALLQGSLALQDLKRLLELVTEKKGEIAVTLTFAKDAHGFRTICGKIRAQLVFTCQRCLRPVTYALEIPVKLSPVTNEARAKELLEDYDPLFVTTELLVLADIIEEELLLNLPVVPRHEASECPLKIPDNWHS